MGVYRLLDLVARNVLATAADRVLDPVHVGKVTVLAANDAVPRVKPEVAPRLNGSFGVAPIARRDAVWFAVAHYQLPRFSIRHLLVVFVNDPHLETFDLAPHAAGSLFGGRRPYHVVELGHPKGVDEENPEPLGERFEEIRRRRWCESDANPMRSIRWRRFLVPQYVHHGAEQVGDRRIGSSRLFPEARGRETLAQDVGGTGAQRLHKRVQGVGVEKWQACVEHVFGADT